MTIDFLPEIMGKKIRTFLKCWKKRTVNPQIYYTMKAPFRNDKVKNEDSVWWGKLEAFTVSRPVLKELSKVFLCKSEISKENLECQERATELVTI